MNANQRIEKLENRIDSIEDNQSGWNTVFMFTIPMVILVFGVIAIFISYQTTRDINYLNQTTVKKICHNETLAINKENPREFYVTNTEDKNQTITIELNSYQIKKFVLQQKEVCKYE